MRLIALLALLQGTLFAFTEHQSLIDITQELQKIESFILEEERKILEFKKTEDTLKQTQAQNMRRIMDCFYKIRHFQNKPRGIMPLSGLSITDTMHLSVLFKSLTPFWNFTNTKAFEELAKNIAFFHEHKKSHEKMADLQITYQQKILEQNKLLESKYSKADHKESKADDENALIRSLSHPQKTSRTPRLDNFSLRQPVVGMVTYHKNTLTIKARLGAQVAAPSTGTIIFSGRFANQTDHVVVIQTHNVLIMMKGLGALTCQLGEQIQQGEPIGRMPSPTHTQAVETLLKIELHQNSERMNPETYFQPLVFS